MIGPAAPRPERQGTRDARLPLLAFAEDRPARPAVRSPLRTAGLFAGIGGIELGLARAGHETLLLCEIDAAARAVLAARFPNVPLHDDVKTLESLPKGTSLVAAGFPCQDLSQAGKTAGIEGSRSGLVGEVFRLLERSSVDWVLIENVPFMLHLGKGRALGVILDSLEDLGFRWAYRIVDSRAFGLPQRRQRVFILASRAHDPRHVLFVDDAGVPSKDAWTGDRAFGFYWTEGVRGLGAAVDAIPTLKGGSTIGIPSPPAILMPDGLVGTPHLLDAERLQGFPTNWTKPAESVARRGERWHLVGNAVTVRVARWIGKRLLRPGYYVSTLDTPLRPGEPWPSAASNSGDGRFVAHVSAWPCATPSTPLHVFLQRPVKPLSARATAGFLSRARSGNLRFPRGFLEAMQAHLDRVLAAQSPGEAERLRRGARMKAAVSDG